jgi:hypothetical protein
MSIDLIIILKKIFKEEILQGEDHLLITEVDHLLIIEVGRLLTIEVNQEILTQLLTVTTNNKIRKKEI